MLQRIGAETILGAGAEDVADIHNLIQHDGGGGESNCEEWEG